MRHGWRFAVVVTIILAGCAGINAPGENHDVKTPITAPTPTFPADEPPPAGAAREFKTDFSKRLVAFSEILSGGPPRDGIPAIDAPTYETIAEADGWLKPQEPVILVQVGTEIRAYPIQVLMWHEIVNDTLGGLPLAITFCPLCNTAIAFERTFAGRALDFGTTGRLRYSNLIMYDRQTETWWQQATGEGIVGELTGSQLTYYPAVMIAWESFKEQFPTGSVLSRETGFSRNYGKNPYRGYDDINNPPFLYDGPDNSGRLQPTARVLTVDLNGKTVAYPYEVLSALGVVNDEVGGEAVVVFWRGGTASALDKDNVADGRDVGAAAAYGRQLDGQVLTFYLDGEIVRDRETNTSWDLFGNGIDGELKGKQLTGVLSINHFWFSWAAFRPETRIFSP